MYLNYAVNFWHKLIQPTVLLIEKLTSYSNWNL